MALEQDRLITTNSTPANGIQHMKSVHINVYTANQTLDSDNYEVVCDTDTTGAFTITLPAGVTGTEYRIVNAGTSENDVTISPDGAELLLGVNSSFALTDGETLLISYSTMGWN